MSTPTLTDLLNRLAVRTQPKRHMLEEFGTIISEALAAKLISEDFYNYGITDLGLSKRGTLRAGITSSVAQPIPTQTTTASQEPAMNLHLKKLLEIIGRFEMGASLTDLEGETNTSTPTLRLRINELLKHNSIIRIGEGLPGRPYRYCIPEQAVSIELDAIENESFESKTVESLVTRPPVTLEEIQVAYAEPAQPKPVTPNSKPAPEFQPPLLKLEQPAGLDLEITAMQTMLAALEPLDDMARSRAMGWVSSRLRMS